MAAWAAKTRRQALNKSCSYSLLWNVVVYKCKWIFIYTSKKFSSGLFHSLQMNIGMAHRIGQVLFLPYLLRFIIVYCIYLLLRYIFFFALHVGIKFVSPNLVAFFRLLLIFLYSLPHVAPYITSSLHLNEACKSVFVIWHCFPGSVDSNLAQSLESEVKGLILHPVTKVLSTVVYK